MTDQVDGKTEIFIDPTLFLFLGTTPGKVGWRLKKLLHDAYGDIPAFKFLWLDIDQNMDQEGRSWFNRSEERVELSGFDPAQIRHNINNYPYIKAWWPETAPPAGRLSGGGGSPRQMRLVGRMAFFAKFNDSRTGPSLYSRLLSSLHDLGRIQSDRSTEEYQHEKYRFRINANNISVYLIYSPCGGTGSSMAFDLAYLCRSLITGNPPKVIGYSLAPSVFLQVIRPTAVAQRKKVQANAYAWFKEYNSLLENPQWNVTYGDGIKAEVAGLPFDTQYLVGIENQGGYRLSSLDDVASMMAQALFLSSGTNTSQAIKTFQANEHSTSERFEGKIRAYSSFSAASLIFPKDRLKAYCGTQHALQVLKKGFLGAVEGSVINRTASLALSRNGLLDNSLIPALLNVGRMPYSLEQSLKNAEDVATAISILNNQVAESQQNIADKKKRIKENYKKLLKDKKELLAEEVLMVVRQHGLNTAIEVVKKVIDPANIAQSEGSGVTTLNQIKGNIHQHGVTENDLSTDKKEFDLNKRAITRLDDGPEDKIERMINMRGWLRKFKTYKESAIRSLKDIDETQLQLSAQKEAIRLIDEITAYLEALSRQLMTCKVEIEKQILNLETRASRLLRPSEQDSFLYEFLREVEIDFEEYYQSFSENITENRDYGFIPPCIDTIKGFVSWVNRDFEGDVLAYTSMLFEDALNATSLLDIIQRSAEKEGREPKAYLQELLDSITKYSIPFFNYNPNVGMENPETFNAIGVEDKNNPILPIRDGDIRFEVETTGIKDRIDVAVFQYGLPVHMLHDIPACRSMYLDLISPDSAGNPPNDPLHILPGVDRFSEDFVPDKAGKQREVFAIGIAFNYIIQKGHFYYVDPGKTYQEHNTTPPNEFRLDRGRENASQAFSQKPDLVKQVESDIQKDVMNMGNAAAIEYLEEVIKEHFATIASYSSPSEQTLRRVLENEIEAIRDYQSSLRI